LSGEKIKLVVLVVWVARGKSAEKREHRERGQWDLQLISAAA